MLPMCTICLLNLHHRFVDGPNEHVHGMVYSCKPKAEKQIKPQLVRWKWESAGKRNEVVSHTLTGYPSTRCACSSVYRYEHPWCASPFRRICGFLWWRVGHASWNRYCVRVSTNGWYIRGSQLRWSPTCFVFQLLVWPFYDLTGYWTNVELTYTIEYHWHVVCCADEMGEQKTHKEKQLLIIILPSSRCANQINFSSNLNAIRRNAMNTTALTWFFPVVRNQQQTLFWHPFMMVLRQSATNIETRSFFQENHTNIDEISTFFYSSKISPSIAFKISVKLFKITWMICDSILFYFGIHTSQ